MNWFEERAKRKRAVVVLPTPETYYKRFELYLTLEDYWCVVLHQYNNMCDADMDFCVWLSFEHYNRVKHKSRWSDEDYADTRLYRKWRADVETVREQKEYAMRGSEKVPVVIWPDRRRNMIRTFKKTGA
jgi:hypothetical protein